MMLTRRCLTDRKQPSRRGAVATEFAVLLPFIVFLFLATVDFCRIFYFTQTLQACANNAVLYASGTADPKEGVKPSDAAIEAAITSGAKLSPPLTTKNVTLDSDSNVATVTVTYYFQTFFLYPGLPRKILLSRKATAPQSPIGS